MKKQSWDDYEAAADRGPLSLFFKVLGAVLVMGVVLGVVGHVFRWFGEAAAVAQEEVGPRKLLEKYTWFKDAAAQLDKKRADIDVYQGRVSAMVESNGGAPRVKWAREDREQMNVWSSEVAGVKASYNQLAAEYNAKMVGIHWRFANVGDLPAGAMSPLPREFKPYIDN